MTQGIVVHIDWRIVSMAHRVVWLACARTAAMAAD
jgi:hypothetical protein